MKHLHALTAALVSLPVALCAADAELPVYSLAKLVWHIGELAPSTVPPLTKAMMLAVQFKDLKSSGELVSWNGKGGRVAVRLLIGDVKPKQSLIVELATDARPTPLQLSVPLDAI